MQAEWEGREGSPTASPGWLAERILTFERLSPAYFFFCSLASSSARSRSLAAPRPLQSQSCEARCLQTCTCPILLCKYKACTCQGAQQGSATERRPVGAEQPRKPYLLLVEPLKNSRFPTDSLHAVLLSRAPLGTRPAPLSVTVP